MRVKEVTIVSHDKETTKGTGDGSPGGGNKASCVDPMATSSCSMGDMVEPKDNPDDAPKMDHPHKETGTVKVSGTVGGSGDNKPVLRDNTLW